MNKLIWNEDFTLHPDGPPTYRSNGTGPWRYQIDSVKHCREEESARLNSLGILYYASINHDIIKNWAATPAKSLGEAKTQCQKWNDALVASER